MWAAQGAEASAEWPALIAGGTLWGPWRRQAPCCMVVVVQDGAAAGQTIPHVHIHCVPRNFKDLEHNDQIYDRIDEADAQELCLRQRYASARCQRGVPAWCTKRCSVQVWRGRGGQRLCRAVRAEHGAAGAHALFWRRCERVVPTWGCNGNSGSAGACREPLGSVDVERKARTAEEMADEASRFRALMSADASARARR